MVGNLSEIVNIHFSETAVFTVVRF